MSAKIGILYGGVLLAGLIDFASGEVRGQVPQPPYAAPTNAEMAGAAFAPPDPQPPQTARPLVAMQPPRATAPALNPQSTFNTQPAYPSAALQPDYAQQGPAPAPPSFWQPQPPPALQPPYTQIQPPPAGFWQPAQPSPPVFVFPITSRFWLRTELLLWWTKSAPMPTPLVTTGSPLDSVPGALGQPGTQVLLGGTSNNLGLISGLRLETGFWFDDQRRCGLEVGYFFLGRQVRAFSAFSDDSGNPLLARPTIDAQSMTEGTYVDSFPGAVTGGVTVTQRSQFLGANVDGALNFVQSSRFRLDGLVGFRYLNLAESLDIVDQYADVSRGALTFGGAPIRFSDMLSDIDAFRTTNSFYGGSLGGRLNWAAGRWLFNATGKVAFGTVQERTVMLGSTTLTTFSGSQSVLPGGILATTANMGNYYRSPFAVVPETYLNIGYQITPWLTARLGYSFIYLSNVVRPGNQVNRVTSANLVPSDPTYGTAGPNLPSYQFHTSSYWAQGLNLGLDLRF